MSIKYIKRKIMIHVKQFFIILFDISHKKKKNEIQISTISRIRKYIKEQGDTFSEDSLDTWSANRKLCSSYLMKRDINNFMRWHFIRNTMFVHNASYIDIEYEELMKSRFWKDYRTVLKEDDIGNPPKYNKNKQTSSNLIHHLYSLMFLESTIARIKDYDYIFEFGGGYGSFCRLCRKLGYRGKYIILDIPEFSLLQLYFLRSLNYNVDFENEISEKTENALITDISDSVLPKENEKTLFVALWSFSETPLDFRKYIFKQLPNFQDYFFAYQNSIENVDNKKYFNNLQKSLPNYTWSKKLISHLPGNQYLVANRQIENYR